MRATSPAMRSSRRTPSVPRSWSPDSRWWHAGSTSRRRCSRASIRRSPSSDSGRRARRASATCRCCACAARCARSSSPSARCLNFLARLCGVATFTRRFVRRRRGHRLPDRRHAQDPARLARARQVRDGGRRRREPPHGPLRRDPRQGQPHRRGGRRRGGRRGRARERRRRTCACRSRSNRRRRPKRRWPPAPTGCCSTTARPRSCAHSPRASHRARCSRPRAASRSKRCARSPRPACTASRSARSRSSAPNADVALESSPAAGAARERRRRRACSTRCARRARTRVSGAALSDGLGVSRAQIWKHVEALRARGYAIDGEPGGGYRLVAAPDRLYAEEMQPASRRAGSRATYGGSTTPTRPTASPRELARRGRRARHHRRRRGPDARAAAGSAALLLAAPPEPLHLDRAAPAARHRRGADA